jgi:hypothetical protein
MASLGLLSVCCGCNARRPHAPAQVDRQADGGLTPAMPAFSAGRWPAWSGWTGSKVPCRRASVTVPSWLAPTTAMLGQDGLWEQDVSRRTTLTVPLLLRVRTVTRASRILPAHARLLRWIPALSVKSSWASSGCSAWRPAAAAPLPHPAAAPLRWRGPPRQGQRLEATEPPVEVLGKGALHRR